MEFFITAVMPRLERGIQYSRGLSIQTRASGILDRPVKPGDDTEQDKSQLSYAANSPHGRFPVTSITSIQPRSCQAASGESMERQT